MEKEPESDETEVTEKQRKEAEGMDRVLSSQLNDLARSVQTILRGKTTVILYGSYARGDNNESSDIDLMVLTDMSDHEIVDIEDRIADVAYDFELEKGIPVSVNVKNKAHFQYWKNTLPYYKNIDREGVVLAG